MTTATEDGVKRVETPEGTLTYNDESHTYNLDGVEIPSVSDVTGVLDKSGPLMGWAVKETCNSFREQFEPGTAYDRNEIEEMISNAKSARWRSSDDALDIGSEAHKWMERHIKDKLDGGDGLADDLPDREPVLEAVVEFLSWEEEHVEKWLMSEAIVCVPGETFIGGTFDALAVTDKGKLLIDFKTSGSIYDSHMLQIGGYKTGYHYTYEQPLDGVCILRTPKDEAEIEPHVETDEDELIRHENAFYWASGLNLWRNNNGV